MSRSCRFCSSKNLSPVLDLGAQPLANSYLSPERLDQAEPHFPLPLLLCNDCALLQTIDAASSHDIFSDYLYFSSFSTSWVEHARNYVEMIAKRLKLGAGSKVVEIASNDGYLLQFFVQKGIPCLGVEPAANVAVEARKKGVESLVAFFGVETATKMAAERGQADLMIGNNVFAHVPNINDFVGGLKIALAPTGTITLEFPHAVRMVEEVQFDTIYHEHFSYYTLIAASRIMAKHGLEIYDVEQLPTHGGSLRIFVGHQGAHPVGPAVTNLHRQETEAGYGSLPRYLGFAEDTKRVKRDLLEFLIGAKRSGKSVVGYGAPAKGNTLLNYCGVRTDFIDYTVDRSPHKQNHYLPGVRIPILSPEHMQETKPDYVLILPWNLKEEIMGQMAHIREWGGRFVVAVPKLEILK